MQLIKRLKSILGPVSAGIETRLNADATKESSRLNVEAIEPKDILWKDGELWIGVPDSNASYYSAALKITAPRGTPIKVRIDLIDWSVVSRAELTTMLLNGSLVGQISGQHWTEREPRDNSERRPMVRSGKGVAGVEKFNELDLSLLYDREQIVPKNLVLLKKAISRTNTLMGNDQKGGATAKIANHFISRAQFRES